MALALGVGMNERSIVLESAGRSVTGRRANNQDALLLRPDAGLFVVADGMGGYEGGEVASATAIASIEAFITRLQIDPDGTWPLRERGDLGPLARIMEAGLRIADRDVRVRRTGRLCRMGTTASVVLFRGRRLVAGHVGDSRIYRLRDRLALLTSDHSVAAELRRAGTHDDDIAARFQHCLTRAIGMDGVVLPDVHEETVAPGDVYLICSDGLWGALEDDVIAQLLRGTPSARACEILVDAAHDAGSTDNITAIVVRVHSAGRMP
jgi:PPM family protein phosphatase